MNMNLAMPDRNPVDFLLLLRENKNHEEYVHPTNSREPQIEELIVHRAVLRAPMLHWTCKYFLLA